MFFQGTDYTTAARVAANFAWRRGARRMAFFYCSTSAFCTDPVDGAKTFLKLLGGTRIGRDLFVELFDDAATIERKVLRFFHDELRHRATHPDYEIADWIWFGNTSPNAASLGKARGRAPARSEPAGDRPQPARYPRVRKLSQRRHRGLRHDRFTQADHRPQSGAWITRLGPRGRMETIGQPLSRMLQSCGAKHLCFGIAQEAEAGAFRAGHVALRSANARLSSR